MISEKEHLVFISHSSKNAPVAQLICHRLEEQGIRCWIAPRDIHTTDWADSIMEGLSKSDVFVIIVSEESIWSGEVTKEVTQATSVCEYILPFKVDNAELNPRMKYHLGPCHWLDATTPPLEQRVQELIDRIQNLTAEDNVYLNSFRKKLRSHILLPKKQFTGRDAELDEIAGHLQEDHVLFLQGMGGIGKSELAKAYAKKYADRYDTVLFIGYRGSILDTICSNEFGTDNFAAWDPKSESREAFFDRKLKALKEITNEFTLVILDNYDVGYDEYFDELADLPFHLLVTTRTVQYDYPSMSVGPISDRDKAIDLFRKSSGGYVKPSETGKVRELLEMVAWHTMTVDLLGRQMRASGTSVQEMIDILKAGTMKEELQESISADSKERLSAASFIRRLFRMEELSDEEKRILTNMTLVPFTGIDRRLFKKILDLANLDDINDLTSHSWLMLDDDTNMLSMHPVIAEVVREEYKPTAESCRDYITGLDRQVHNLWPKDLKEREKLWPLYETLIKTYPEGPEDLWNEYSQLASNAWICSRYELSIAQGHRFFEYTKKHFPDDRRKIGMAASLLGGDYYNSGDNANAEVYYEIGLECQLAAISETSSEADWGNLSRAYQQVARCARYAGKYEKSKELFEKSLQINEGRNINMYYGSGLMEYGELYYSMGEYEKALVYINKSMDVIKASNSMPDLAIVLKQIGRCLTGLGRYDEAEKILRQSVEMNIEYNGERHRQTFNAKEAMADLMFAKGDRKEAANMYMQLQLDMERDFGENNPHVLEFRRKCEMAQGVQK